MITVSVAQVNALIESGRKDGALTGRCKQEARSYMAARGVRSRIGEDAVADAFLLKELFRDLMNRHNASAITTNALGSTACTIACRTRLSFKSG